MNRKLDCNVLVAGAGVAGLAAALGFARNGARVQVLERRALDQGGERGDVLHFGGWQALERLGVGEWIEKSRLREVSRFEIWDEDRRALVALDLSEKGPARILRTIPYSRLRHCLVAACLRTGNVSFLWNLAATDLATDDSTARVTGFLTTRGRLTASLSVIATGTTGLARSQRIPARPQHDYQQIFVSAHAQDRSGSLHAGIYVLSRRGILIAVPLAEQRLRLGLQVPSGRQRIDDSRSFLEEAELRLPRVASQIDQVGDVQQYALKSQLADIFSVPGAVLCGDAAHTVHPAGGQGMNLALVNAVSLVHRLHPVLASPERTDAEGAAWGREARARAKRVHFRTDVLGRLASTRSPLPLAFAKGLIATGANLPYLKAQIFAAFARVS
ncbi:MAG: FAD-dependent monooxygenase [Xanthobacteraceae bacterium]|nr:FAD-dependent monooxygenase [Xanthobacteraceae bacterium]